MADPTIYEMKAFKFGFGKKKAKTIKITRIPKPKSMGEELFAQQLAAYNILFEREWKFHSDRRWKIDFKLICKYPGYTIFGVEIEGGTWTGGRHTRGMGFQNDLEKYNAATLADIRIYRFTTDQVKSGHAIDFVRKIIQR